MTEGSVLRQAPPRLAEIQAPVKDRLEQVVEELRRIVISDFEMIEEVNDYLLLMQGKLFRPTLLLLANEIGGEPSDDAVTLGAVVELVHLATLVHDDAVDHSVLRRGLPTVNSLWTHQVAIIMGDYLYSRSVTELARVGEMEHIGVLATAANEMSVGEMRQLTSYDALDFSEGDYDQLIAAKTASLMAAACEMGAVAGVDRHRGALRRFGHNLGMAFQIADDILDYTGSEEITGKPTGHDLRERKVTLPLVAAMERATGEEVREIRRFFTLVDPSDEAIEAIIEIARRRGGIEYAREQAAAYAREAEEALDAVEGTDGPAGTAALGALKASVAYAVERSR